MMPIIYKLGAVRVNSFVGYWEINIKRKLTVWKIKSKRKFPNLSGTVK